MFEEQENIHHRILSSFEALGTLSYISAHIPVRCMLYTRTHTYTTNATVCSSKLPKELTAEAETDTL